MAPLKKLPLAFILQLTEDNLKSKLNESEVIYQHNFYFLIYSKLDFFLRRDIKYNIIVLKVSFLSVASAWKS